MDVLESRSKVKNRSSRSSQKHKLLTDGAISNLSLIISNPKEELEHSSVVLSRRSKTNKPRRKRSAN